MKMMKKFIALIVLLILPMALFAQNIPDSVAVPLPPDDWTQVVFNFNQWFGSFAGLAALTAFVAAFFNGLLKVTKGFPKQLVAWVVALLLAVVANLTKFGYMAEYTIWQSLIHGFMAGLASNGIFKVPLAVDILKWVEGWFKKT